MTGVFLLVAVLGVGVRLLRLHTLPERMAHSSKKLQFEVVAILGLIALFTHIHLFWIAGLLLAVIDLPDWGTSMQRMADSLERMSDPKADPPPVQEPVVEATPPAPEQKGA